MKFFFRISHADLGGKTPFFLSFFQQYKQLFYLDLSLARRNRT